MMKSNHTDYRIPLTPEMKRKIIIISHNWKTTAKGLDLAHLSTDKLEKHERIISAELDHWTDKEAMLMDKKFALELKVECVNKTLKQIKLDHEQTSAKERDISSEIVSVEKTLYTPARQMFNSNLLLRGSNLTTFFHSYNSVRSSNTDAVCIPTLVVALRYKLRKLRKHKHETCKKLVEISNRQELQKNVLINFTSAIHLLNFKLHRIGYIIHKTNIVYEAVKGIRQYERNERCVDISDEYFWHRFKFVNEEVREKMNNSCSNIIDDDCDFELVKKILKQPLYY